MTNECDNTANAGKPCPGCGEYSGHSVRCPTLHPRPKPEGVFRTHQSYGLDDATRELIASTVKLIAPILEHGVNRGLHLLQRLLEGQDYMSAAMQTVLDKVTALKTSEDSLIALVTGLAQQIRDNVGDQAALTALATDLDAEAAKVAKAVTDNTITP